LGSWAAQVPAVLLCTHFYRNDLYGLFTGVTIGYAAVDVMLMWVVVKTDWALYASEAARRSEAKPLPTETAEHSSTGDSDRDIAVVSEDEAVVDDDGVASYGGLTLVRVQISADDDEKGLVY
jgi:hypothetical protein